MWTVQDAKAQLSEILRRAKAGEPQVIGTQDPCVVISANTFKALTQGQDQHLGRWLIEHAPSGIEIDLPPRGESRVDPFDVD
ncbi:type II toxin-antitoxin system prevent-host-death family antitoxin [Inquilinus limosus]|uniref:type II toxin-antitoxin system prevent-host-death family antitoxin n=1 Tax=Inquilinus limosus TaxID=171674 RepID=UPI00138AF8D1|nr:type II toxin-antitoxin system prevent-host-death family antitoxin [Inquilinus limosus]